MSRLQAAAAGAVAAVLAAAAGAWLAGLAVAGLAGVAVYAAVLLALLLVERVRYKRLLKAPPVGAWRATPERFIDPASGRLVVVWEEPGTGRRAYVAGGADGSGRG